MGLSNVRQTTVRHINRMGGAAVLLLVGCFATAADADTGDADTGDAAKSRRPNMVVIIADDLGYGETGMMGNTQIPTPHPS